MANIHERISSILRELTEFVNDGIEGYEKAAIETRNPEHAAFYRDLADQRRVFARELNELISRHGGKIKIQTTIRGKIYRQWMEVQALLTNRDDKAILNASLYGEQWAQQAYNDALEQDDLPQNIRQLIERQRQALIEAYSTLEDMKHQPH
jgi:uncharacterized protein (TIGR02284 family)